jgi:N-acetylmuramoyl-L-alanine amidase
MHSVYLSGSCQEKNIGIDGMPEEMRMQAIVDDASILLKAKGVTVYRNNPAWDLGTVISDSNSKKPDLHVALHSNAGGGSGVETWTYRTAGTNSAAFGAKLQAAVVKAIGLKDRGIKDATIGKISEVTKTDATAVLIELFFHDNATDVYTFNAKRQAVIDAIVRTILEWFSINQATDYPTEMINFAVAKGWLDTNRNPYTLPMWWELIAFTKKAIKQ